MVLKKGLFIVFEGGEGCGKTTQIKLLARKLKRLKIDFLVTREPGGTPLSEQIREILLNPLNKEISPLAEVFLFSAARCQHVQQKIKPALKEGKVVICDRFSGSTVAYQIYGRQQFELLKKFSVLNDLATGGLEPDLTILLDIPSEVGLARCKKAGVLTRFDKEEISFHKRVNTGYRKIAKRKGWVIIDATKDITEISEEVWKVVQNFIKERR